MHLLKYKQKLLDNIAKRSTGCWEWQGYRLPTGYGRTRYCGENMLTHRLSWIVHRGQIPPEMLVCHKCDNPACCNPKHLFLGSHKDNTADAMQKGRFNPGDAFGDSRQYRRKRLLTDDQVNEILTTDAPIRELATRFGCSYQNVWLIRTGRRKIAPCPNECHSKHNDNCEKQNVVDIEW